LATDWFEIHLTDSQRRHDNPPPDYVGTDNPPPDYVGTASPRCLKSVPSSGTFVSGGAAHGVANQSMRDNPPGD